MISVMEQAGICPHLFGKRLRKIMEHHYTYYVSSDYSIMLHWNGDWRTYEDLELVFEELRI